MKALYIALLVCSNVGTNERVIDGFEYGETAAARSAWTAAEGTPPVQVVRQDGRSVLQFQAPFGSDQKLERTILDRVLKLNLAGSGQFALELKVQEPKAAGRITLYFRSGRGWYGCSTALEREGWQTLRFSKASFRIEGRPTGWHQIDGVRISVWRGQGLDSAVWLRRLAAEWHEVAVVVPSGGGRGGEGRGASRAALQFSRLLAELGLGADAVSQKELARGALATRRVAVLAYNPNLGPEATAALQRFLAAGGKLFACYSLPGPLAKALGIARFRYLRPDQEGALAEVRFQAPDIPGLPRSVRQASWNINIPEPADGGARIIGYWYDQQGKPTGHAALAISDRGAFFSHVILEDDREGKKQMLAAILGRLHPPLWRQMAEQALQQAGQIGHLNGLDELRQYVESSGRAEAQRMLADGLKAQAAARTWFERRRYVEAVSQSGQARLRLVGAYLRAAPSPKREGRAFWNHSGTGAYPGDWDRTAKQLAQAGFNMLLPNMLWAGRAHYASDLLPRSSTYEQYGDQIAQCVAAAHKVGLEVHVWKVNHNLSGAPKQFVQMLRSQKRLQVGVDGKSYNWLCPSHPENFKLEKESMLEVARNYPVDGLHFDYIRYPDRRHCYCDGCRQRFQADTGLTVAHWPQDCYSGPLHDQYHDWRCQQITRLVRAVSREAKRIRPRIKISAAVFGQYPRCRETVGQDWVAWVKAGYLDFVCPMDYTQSDLAFRSLVESQLKLVGGRIPLYPGVGAWRLPAERAVGQVQLARQLGAAGFTMFNLTAEAAETLVPAVALGTGKCPAIPPHRR